MKCYIDSSVLLRFVLQGDTMLEKASDYDEIGSSVLLEVECLRVLDRLRLEHNINDYERATASEMLRKILEGCALIGINETVLEKARQPYPTVVGTLDAIHLASALLWKEVSKAQVDILTFDRQMSVCARALGFSVISS